MNHIVPLLTTIIFFFSYHHLQAQDLEVAGKAKIVTMDKVNTADSVVVRLGDGTLAVRDVSTLSEFQILSISNDTIYLSNGGFVKLPPDQVNDADADPANEIETWSTLAGIPVGFSDGTDDVDDADNDSSNEIQTISLLGDSISLSDGGGKVNIDPSSTNELQVLSISNDTIYLTDGGFAKLPEDNDAGWTMDEDTIHTVKYVGIGTTSPDQKLHISNGSAGNVIAVPNSIAVLETDTDGYLSILYPSANESGILFGNEFDNPSGSILFNQNNDGGFTFNIGGAGEQLKIDSDGLVTAQNRITNVTDPVDAQDAATKSYVDNILLSFGISLGSTGIQGLLNAGHCPLDIISAGAVKDSLYGKTYQGGLIFYLDDQDTIPGMKGLVAAPMDQDYEGDFTRPWGCYETDLPIPDVNVFPPSGAGAEIGDGATNTVGIDTASCSVAGDAAVMCAVLSLNGFDDWFLPSVKELNLMWENLADSDGGGTNSGPSDPGNIGGFAASFYWSSSEFDVVVAWVQSFLDGLQFLNFKFDDDRVRAIRAF